MHVSYLEIYNEQLYDLLAENPGDSNSMAVQEDPTRGAFVSLARVHISRGGVLKVLIPYTEEVCLVHCARPCPDARVGRGGRKVRGVGKPCPLRLLLICHFFSALCSGQV